MLASHVRSGGQLMVLLDPGAPQSVTGFLRAFGVEAVDDLIVDEQNRFLGADSFTARIPHLRSGGFRQTASTPRRVPPQPQFTSHRRDRTNGMRVALLAMSSPDSWSLVGAGAEPEQTVRFREGTDRRGPLPVGVLVSMKAEEDKQEAAAWSRVAWLSSATRTLPATCT